MFKSDKSEDWVKRACAANPIALLDNGNYTSGPVRLSWPNIFEKGKPMDEGAEGKYGSVILFPAVVNLDLLQIAVLNCAKENFASNFGADGQPFGLHFPFRDQQVKQHIDGYVPGSIFLTLPSGQRPPCVDHNLQNIIEESRVYPGVWAIVSMNVFSWDRKVKKGVSFGLQSVMIVADDLPLGSVADPAADFARVQKIGTDTQYSGAAAFGMSPNTTLPANDPEAETRRLLGLG